MKVDKWLWSEWLKCFRHSNDGKIIKSYKFNQLLVRYFSINLWYIIAKLLSQRITNYFWDWDMISIGFCGKRTNHRSNYFFCILPLIRQWENGKNVPYKVCCMRILDIQFYSKIKLVVLCTEHFNMSNDNNVLLAYSGKRFFGMF